MALSTSLQVTRNFGNLYTVNKNVFKFVNQGIIIFHRTSEFEYRKINLKCILFMNKKKNVLLKELLNLLFSASKINAHYINKTLIKYDNFYKIVDNAYNVIVNL